MRNFETNKDLRKQINLYFDNALANEEATSLIEHIKSNPRAEDMFNKEKTFRDYIKTNFKRSNVSSNLIEAIKNKINILR